MKGANLQTLEIKINGKQYDACWAHRSDTDSKISVKDYAKQIAMQIIDKHFAKKKR